MVSTSLKPCTDVSGGAVVTVVAGDSVVVVVDAGLVIDVVEVVVVEGCKVVVVVVVVELVPGSVVQVPRGGFPAAVHSAKVGAAFRLAYGSMALGVRVCPVPAAT